MKTKISIEFSQREQSKIMQMMTQEMRQSCVRTFDRQMSSLSPDVFRRLVAKAMSKAFVDVVTDHFDVYLEQNREAIFNKACRKAQAKR